MSALAFNLLRIGYLVLLWLFVLFAIGVLRRDLLTRARDGATEQKAGRKRRRKADPTPEPQVAYAAPVATAVPAPAPVPVSVRSMPTNGPSVGEIPSGRSTARTSGNLAPAAVPSELFVTAGELAGTRIPLADTPVVIGRAPGSTLLISDDYASSRHARIFTQDGKWFLEDLGSTNGTFVGGKRVTGTIPLAIGNNVQIGQSTIELR